MYVLYIVSLLLVTINWVLEKQFCKEIKNICVLINKLIFFTYKFLTLTIIFENIMNEIEYKRTCNRITLENQS